MEIKIDSGCGDVVVDMHQLVIFVKRKIVKINRREKFAFGGWGRDLI